MKNIAIFASGSGTNAQNIIEHFLDHENIAVTLVVSNKKEAYVHQRAASLNVPSVTFSREQFYQSEEVLETLAKTGIDFIVLAGFLWLIPENILNKFTGRMINIHPALLPKYGGKGMYGKHVHEAVINNNEPESGISIHFVNEEYDKGALIFQARCPVEKDDTPETLAQRVHKLEYEHYPRVIEELIEKMEN
jgi:phosphoribosylglycinamide formyltransferase-1